MRPYLLLDRADLTETPTEKARRRARVLAERIKRERYEALLRQELASVEELRKVMREPPATPWVAVPRNLWKPAAE